MSERQLRRATEVTVRSRLLSDVSSASQGNPDIDRHLPQHYFGSRFFGLEGSCHPGRKFPCDTFPGEVEMNKYPEQAFSVFHDSTGGLRDNTDELSFLLRPSRHDGVDVFSTHGIRKGTCLRLFPGPASRFVPAENESDGCLLAFFSRRFGIQGTKGYYVHRDFGSMEIGWYLNHSPDPNAYHDEVFDYFASRDIPAGEEITVD